MIASAAAAAAAASAAAAARYHGGWCDAADASSDASYADAAAAAGAAAATSDHTGVASGEPRSTRPDARVVIESWARMGGRTGGVGGGAVGTANGPAAAAGGSTPAWSAAMAMAAATTAEVFDRSSGAGRRRRRRDGRRRCRSQLRRSARLSRHSGGDELELAVPRRQHADLQRVLGLSPLRGCLYLCHLIRSGVRGARRQSALACGGVELRQSFGLPLLLGLSALPLLRRNRQRLSDPLVQ